MKRLTALLLTVVAALASSAVFGATGKSHIPGVFLGATHVDGETDFTWGIEYEYKFNSNWGLGVVYEDTPDGHDGDGVTVKVANLFYHPDSHWRFGVGFGEEEIGGKKPKTKDLYRVIGGYDFHIGDFGIAPTIAYDFIDGSKDALVFGVAIVRPF